MFLFHLTSYQKHNINEMYHVDHPTQSMHICSVKEVAPGLSMHICSVKEAAPRVKEFREES
jgi:hypothetical protein